MDISTLIFIAICMLIFAIAAIVKYRVNMEKLDTEERIYRLRHGLPPRENETEENK